MVPTMDHNKAIFVIRAWMLGREYYDALEAMEWTLAYHRGVRKNGVTPEVSHQLSVVYYLKTILDNLTHPQETLSVGFLHDSPEDYPDNVSIGDIAKTFGPLVAAPVRLCNRYYGEKSIKDIKSYYVEISKSPIASIVKAADRIHNVQTMIGVFNKEKQKKYVQETEEYVLPMIKAARRRFPRQERAYENAKHFLKCQIELIEAIHGGKI